MMSMDTRNCEQCSAVFAPRREHARFCSTSCRVGWNRARAGDLGIEVTALDWTVAAMCDVLEWLGGAGARDRSQAFAVISEAVWWVTIVDATLIRYHVEAYEAVMAGRTPAERRVIEGTFGGLRFVRNQMGFHVDQADFIEPDTGHSDNGRIMAWSWRSVAEPALTLLPPRGQTWEMARYEAYEAHLAGNTMEEVFGRAAAFLKLVSAQAALLAAPAPQGAAITVLNPGIRAV
jgi:hypothetical protein